MLQQVGVLNRGEPGRDATGGLDQTDELRADTTIASIRERHDLESIGPFCAIEDRAVMRLAAAFLGPDPEPVVELDPVDLLPDIPPAPRFSVFPDVQPLSVPSPQLLHIDHTGKPTLLGPVLDDAMIAHVRQQEYVRLALVAQERLAFTGAMRKGVVRVKQLGYGTVVEDVEVPQIVLEPVMIKK